MPYGVVDKISLGCCHPNESDVKLLIGTGEKIHCPGLNGRGDAGIIWYKGNKPMSDQKRASCEENGYLDICTVYAEDTGVYFCDRQIIEKEVAWTIRRAVNATALSNVTQDYSLTMLRPRDNKPEEVELGQSHTLICEVHFYSVIDTRPLKVQWYMTQGGNVGNMIPLGKKKSELEKVKHEVFKVTQRVVIPEVTQQHLINTYTCIARHTVNTHRVTIKLKRKMKANCFLLMTCSIASLLLVAALGVVLHLKWLELQLIFRSHFQHGKHDAGEKDFDVLLSYVWSPPTAEVEGALTLSSPPGAYTNQEACLTNMDLLSSEEGKVIQRSLEVLLPQVLEDRWGYRVFLLERDMLPGGVFTNDVALALKRTQMLICLLSDDYLSNSNAVFVLESGIQALLQNSTLKLLLIWTNRASASFVQPDFPLPTLVQRALKVLPTLSWTSSKPAGANSSFWRSLRKAMPDHRVKLVSLTQDL